ncbi:MAG TPA: UDP-glucose/GDP-mannose dehydrogenase family protein [Candidatus Omnitrophota bacterium]|nr:UDP-glucose/GDP-mannose dehydrogenase family protein [Candidatus Omnitrophota bacterium]HNQ50924.1 UDP-glucose/GDP-mannose dehydrogenase family protein [Candidatus Omnitrophota bacterium]
MQKAAVIGAGYVGLVTATCLAELGHRIICVDNDRKKLENLKKGIIPIFEPGLAELVRKNQKAKRLIFSNSIKDAAQGSTVIFICVNTPPLPDGGADLSMVERVASEIGRAMTEYKVIVGKSTVPAETHEKIKRTVRMITKGKGDFDVASNPEFLREGHAVEDTLHPDRIVVGVESKRAEKIMRDLYRPIKAPLLVTNITTAEIIKHACNSFLSTKISYINAVANICERVNADVEKVAEGMGFDKRIARQFLNAGAGFGGNCFPKDLDAFIHLAETKGYNFDLLKAVRKINHDQKKLIMKKVADALWIIKGKTIAVLGLSFKALTDDIRNSIAIDIVKLLKDEGANIRAYDPQALEKAKQALTGVTLCKSAYDACKGADCCLVMTEWDEFRKLDLAKMKKLLRQPIVIDARNIYDPQQMIDAGFVYKCIGRGSAYA